MILAGMPDLQDAEWPDLAPVRRGRAVAACALQTEPAPLGGWTAWLDWLDPGERDRAMRFRREGDRDSYIAAHALLRHLLSRCLAEPLRGPATWRFVADANGKPRLPESDVSVSLSHTAGLAACAVVAGHDVGIDAECLDRPQGTHDLVAQCLTPAEAATLAGLAPTHRHEAFLGYWTLKEALAKATGDGLGLPFGEIEFALDPPRVLRAPARAGDPATWQVHQWHGATGRHVLALAVRRRGADLPVLRWQACARPRPDP